MDAKKYRITCTKCKQSSLIQVINGQTVIYIDQVPIISSRLRPDLEWGFECVCGNDSRVALEERDNLPFLIQMPDENRKQKVISDIVKSLTKKNHLRFRMETA